MTHEQVLARIQEEKLVAILRGVPMDRIDGVVGALVRGGVKVLEFTFDHAEPDCVKANSEKIRHTVEKFGDQVLVGCGTTLTVEEAEAAFNAGACLMISPNVDEAVIRRAKELAQEIPNSFIAKQFENPANPEIQRVSTAREILEQVDGPIHGFCSGIGTGGTITGIGEVLKAANPDMTIWAVEPENAAILSGGSIGTHVQMGIGDGVIPVILNQSIFDDVCIIKDEEAIETSKLLASKEGIMCGISSGTNVAAAIKLAKKLGKGKRVVTVLPDTADRYFSTPLFND